MTRSFSHYTDGVGIYLTTNLKIFSAQDDQLAQHLMLL